MKYLKKFNEELKSSTYKSAATKLKNIGHVRRSTNIQDWAAKVESDEKLAKKKELIEKLSPYGTFQLDIYSSIYNFQTRQRKIDKVMEGEDFYIGIHLNTDYFSDLIFDHINHEGNTLMIPFELYIIPANNECDAKISNLESIESYSSQYWLNNMTLGLSENIFSFEGYDRYSFEFSNRTNANRFRKILMDMLEGKNNFGKTEWINSLSADGLLEIIKSKYERAFEWMKKDNPELEYRPLELSKEDIINSAKRNISVNKLYTN
jgi:hypothetical protein